MDSLISISEMAKLHGLTRQAFIYYELAGDIIDVCLLDTTFYKEQKALDFCMLQAPIKAQ